MSTPIHTEEERPERPERQTWIYWPAWISVLVVLGTVWLLGGPRVDKSERNVCLNNLKQIGLAIAMYADEDRHHRCPVNGDPPTVIGSMRLLTNLITHATILHCPYNTHGFAEADFTKLTRKSVDYSYVPNLIWEEVPDSPVAADRIYSTQKGGHWPISGNHKNAGGNVLYSDGHVSWNNSLSAPLKDKDGKQVVLNP